MSKVDDKSISFKILGSSTTSTSSVNSFTSCKFVKSISASSKPNTFSNTFSFLISFSKGLGLSNVSSKSIGLILFSIFSFFFSLLSNIFSTLFFAKCYSSIFLLCSFSSFKSS